MKITGFQQIHKWNRYGEVRSRDNQHCNNKLWSMLHSNSSSKSKNHRGRTENKPHQSEICKITGNSFCLHKLGSVNLVIVHTATFKWTKDLQKLWIYHCYNWLTLVRVRNIRVRLNTISRHYSSLVHKTDSHYGNKRLRIILRIVNLNNKGVFGF